LKKILLKKQSINTNLTKFSYKINYELDLNKSQYDAVMHNEGAALVIAGAGTGKTRTLVYRVARLIEDGVSPESILLLTFTRKAAKEMLRRASLLLDGRCEKVSGGTFHSFATNILRRYADLINYQRTFNIIDQSDSEDAINFVRNKIINEKTNKRFPTKSTLQRIYSLSKNTVTSYKDFIDENYSWFSDYYDEIENIFYLYDDYKLKYNLMDYDDLLINLLKLLKESEIARKEINNKYQFIMVDEYQDSNRLQHEICLYLAGEKQNIMAVGDDAQSIYSFRGANHQNIIFFPESFGDCKIYKIEENYRSTSQILDLTNFVINEAFFKYEKKLYSPRADGELPKIVITKGEREQSLIVTQLILEYRENGIPLNEIAVLIRSGFHSFDLEIELEKANIPFVKFGGIKFIETAHIKDIIAYLRVIYNQKDALSWQRILLLLEGIGPNKANKILNLIANNQVSLNNYQSIDLGKQSQIVKDLFSFLNEIKKSKSSVADKCTLIAEYYRPILQNKYDDWQKRWRDIETYLNISERYESIEALLQDIALEPPVESVSELTPESKEDEYLTISTIHSAKGLEWKVVFIIWALEGKFPSAKATENIDTMEEERRLFYVAATRAKDYLIITYPINIYDRESGTVLSEPSRFISNIPDNIVEKFVVANE